MRFQSQVKQTILSVAELPLALSVLALLLFAIPSLDSQVWGQSTITSVRSFDGGVTPLFKSARHRESLYRQSGHAGISVQPTGTISNRIAFGIPRPVRHGVGL